MGLPSSYGKDKRDTAVRDVTVACSMAESWDDRTRETVKKIPLLSVRMHDISLYVSHI